MGARPITILIAALGGEGGGVLTDWLVHAAMAADLPVQSTSIPGVAQRTGATTYYVEIYPETGRTSVVAFTDGENNRGRTLDGFKRAYAALPEDVKAIPVFMVLFGEANERELRELVATTGGRVFDARRATLYSVFKDIRAYQ